MYVDRTVFLFDLTFSRFDTIPACDIQTHDDRIYRASISSRVKIYEWRSLRAKSAAISFIKKQELKNKNKSNGNVELE